jgi:hypothetical protein
LRHLSRLIAVGSTLGYMPGAHAILGSNPSGPTTII